MSDFTSLQLKIQEFLPNEIVKFNELMSKHTSFRIGGPAEIMVFPRSREELAASLKASDILGTKTAIIGAGTNILAPDAGLSGIVICLKDALDGMELLTGDRIRVMSGVTMSRAAIFAANHGLSGLEFAHGIPGTVGGGVYMNAGAYGGEICRVCEFVEAMDPKGEIHIFSKEEMQFSYRHSILEESPWIVVSAVFQLLPKPTAEIKEKMKELMGRRSASQPLDLPSAGSAFKRPVGGYAAALIDQCGLKGFAVGDAAISEKHAGFAVNLGNASGTDVKKLLCEVSDIVFKETGIRLEPEVRIW